MLAEAIADALDMKLLIWGIKSVSYTHLKSLVYNMKESNEAHFLSQKGASAEGLNTKQKAILWIFRCV